MNSPYIFFQKITSCYLDLDYIELGVSSGIRSMWKPIFIHFSQRALFLWTHTLCGIGAAIITMQIYRVQDGVGGNDFSFQFLSQNFISRMVNTSSNNRLLYSATNHRRMLFQGLEIFKPRPCLFWQFWSKYNHESPSPFDSTYQRCKRGSSSHRRL